MADFDKIFLSTLSLRRATYTAAAGHHSRAISIHALLAESDFRGWTLNINGPIFLSTLSLRRATIHDFTALYNILISIHALLAESDLSYYFRKYLFLISIHALLAESDGF